MIAEILLVLAGHSSSLFSEDYKLQPDFVPLLHPGERQCLESLGLLAHRYRNIRAASRRLSQSPSRYLCAFCSKLNEILKEEYESLIIETEAKILSKDHDYVGQGSFVPLSAIRATFAEWNSPLAALEALMNNLEEKPSWPAGHLIDLLLSRAETGVYRVSHLVSRLAKAVQRIWCAQLTAFVVHGALSITDSLTSDKYVLNADQVPGCISTSTRESIEYIGRAICTVKAMKWRRQIPSGLSLAHTRLLDSVLPQEQHSFDQAIAQIRADISEWLWSNVITMHDVEDAIDSLANYFLLQNGEFCLAFIREIERLKHSRLTSRSGPNIAIREQDLHLALLRASLGTSAQHDANLSRLRCHLPAGPVRPLLSSLSEPGISSLIEQTRFDDILLGTTLRMSYEIAWPLDLFLHSSDLSIYADIFAFLSSLRHIHTRIHTCWTSLSNTQRARRRWTGHNEGGTADFEARKELLRCGWGVVRLMGWFTDVLLGYMMIDVVESEFLKLKRSLRPQEGMATSRSTATVRPSSSVRFLQSSSQRTIPVSGSKDSVYSNTHQHLDFTTLRGLHTVFLDNLLSGSLLTHPVLTSSIRAILDVIERFAGLVDRWGGDVLPALLFEGSIGGDDSVGQMVTERWEIVKEIDKTLKGHLEAFYEHLSSTTTQTTNVNDASKSILLNATNVSGSLHNSLKARAKSEKVGETRRHVERLLLRLDFNRMFSKQAMGEALPAVESNDILKEGGLA